MNSASFPHERLKKWFLLHKRSFPWREDPTPYAVWISETMLQQTQAAVVVPFFKAWMERFPDVESLARASPDEVIKCWEGLGYYSRARRLHEAARQFLQEHGGDIPSSPEALKKVKGIGDYTLGALLSFAFRKKAAAVDGNVQRVLSRFFAFGEPVDSASGKRALQRLAEELLPEEEPWISAEALIELGALVCKKAPLCPSCPLKATCAAFRSSEQHLFPKKAPRKKTTRLERSVALILCKGEVLIRKTPSGERMADLHEFPSFESREGEPSDLILEKWALETSLLGKLPQVVHTFTRFRALLTPYLFSAAEPREAEGLKWIPIERLDKLAFSAGHRKILDSWLWENA